MDGSQEEGYRVLVTEDCSLSVAAVVAVFAVQTAVVTAAVYAVLVVSFVAAVAVVVAPVAVAPAAAVVAAAVAPETTVSTSAGHSYCPASHCWAPSWKTKTGQNHQTQEVPRTLRKVMKKTAWPAAVSYEQRWSSFE